MSFDTTRRQLLAELANVIIPPQPPMLSASQAGVHEQWLDAVLTARPDLGPPLEQILDAGHGRDPAEFLEHLAQNSPGEFRVLAEVVPGAYFLNPEVRAAIGYDGQSASPIDPRPDYMEDGLLHSVIERGPIYRRTPTS